MLKLIMQKIVDVRKELKVDIACLDKKLSKKMDEGFRGVNKRIDNLNSQADQNSLCFMTNLDSIDKRVTKLEAVC